MANISDAYKYIETGNNTVYNYNYTANDYNDTDEAPQDGGIDLDLVTTMHMVGLCRHYSWSTPTSYRKTEEK